MPDQLPQPTVETVTGPRPVADLGVTLVHEHVTVTAEGYLLDSRVHVDRDAVRREAIEKLSAAKAAGIDSIVDATPVELGRDVELIREVAEASGVTVVCCTGVYAESHGIPAHFKHRSAEWLTELYVHEIREGIGRTGIHAGAIKVATSPGGITDVERTVIAAAAAAQVETGVPIVTHTSGGAGVEQARLFLDHGALMPKIVIGHVDHKFSSLSYYERILRTGANLGFDRCGLSVWMSDEVRAGLIAGFVGMGQQDRVFLSMDSISAQTDEPTEFEAGAPEPLVYLVREFADRLERHGVPRETQRAMLTANPARLFG
jgi:phosphotriesterase-related protein